MIQCLKNNFIGSIYSYAKSELVPWLRTVEIGSRKCHSSLQKWNLDETEFEGDVFRIFRLLGSTVSSQ